MPYAAPKPCPKHPTYLVTRDKPCPVCEELPKNNWGDDKYRGSRHDRGYGTAWDKLRQRILKRDHYLCQEHKKHKVMIPANEVDHIISKANGGTDDPDNLQSLCTDCHREKTARERQPST